MKKIRIGIMGAWRGGSFAKIYSNEFKDEVEIVAICDYSKEKIKHAIDDIKLPDTVQYFEDFDEFIDYGMDAVILCNFFHEHAKYAIKALNKGIHVMSETTAAATLGECVELCEAVEKSGAKYMLGANCAFFYSTLEMERIYNEGYFGRVLYADGEYFHPVDPTIEISGLDDPKHWRKFLPRTYYNMHDLGPLMSITGTVPKKVNAKSIFAPDVASGISKKSGDVAAVILTEMDNGAVFRTTACAALSPMHKWFRIVCENGTIETGRRDINQIICEYNPWVMPDGEEQFKMYDACPEGTSDEVRNSGHGNSDNVLCGVFVHYINGKVEPFFDVYKSVALSATAILGWYSVLEDGREFLIPDFSNKEERSKYAKDYRTPFPDSDGNGITLPCSSKPY